MSENAKLILKVIGKVVLIVAIAAGFIIMWTH